jgi:WD40 repeat protein
MEAHESQLRGLALTADGTKVATASEKGTVVRVWDVATASCLQEFRRGVERANITCLAWSWDHSYLCCTSDKGTAHVFQLDNPDSSTIDEEKKNADLSALSLTQKLFSSMRKSVEGDAKKSICQIRGVPHPIACAFVSNAVNLVAVAGWDADGNGVLLLSSFQNGPNEEPNRVGYHVLCKSSSSRSNETEEARRRRRLHGWTPEIPPTPEGGRLYVGERLEILERGMEQILFEEGGQDDDEFVSVSTVVRSENTDSTPENCDATDVSDSKLESPLAKSDTTEIFGNNGSTSISVNDGHTGSDSVQAEALDDDDPALYESATA